MNERIRDVLVGVVLGIVPLLLLDLAQQLQRDATTSSGWWALGVYLLIGGAVALGLASGRSGPLTPAVAAVILFLAVLPVQGMVPAPWGLRLPVLSAAARLAPELVLVVAAAFATAAARSARG